MRNHNFKTVGILGGMGPWATLFFYQKLLELTPADKDWDHLRVIIDNNPRIPSRSRHYLYGEESPVAGMVDSCNRLAAYPVDFIVIPCNSACYFWSEVQKRVDVPILNIIAVTADAVKRKLPDARLVAVFGGTITYEQKTYEPFLAQHGIRYVHHSADTQDIVVRLIEQIKQNDLRETEQEFRELIKRVRRDYSVDAVILGCTELGLYSGLDCRVPIIDSSYELAHYTVVEAKSLKQGGKHGQP